MKTSHPLNRFIEFGILWMFGITILRGLHRPNDWAEAHWLITYQFGFLKRALPGTLLNPFITQQNAEILITIISTILLGIFFIVLAWMCLGLLRTCDYKLETTLTILSFLTSPYIVMSAYLNGYYDNLLILFSIAGILLVLQGKHAMAAVVMTIGILVHENIFLVGLPSVLFAVLYCQVEKDGRFNLKNIFQQALPFLFPVFAFIALFLYQSYYLNGNLLRNQLTVHLSQFEFVERNRNMRVPDAFTISFLDYTERQSQFFLVRIFNQNYLMRILPTLILMLLFTGNITPQHKNKNILLTLLMAVSLVPLSLHLIARDTSRIWTFPLIVAFLGLWTISKGMGENKHTNKPHILYIVACTAVIMHNIFLQIPLMSGVSERYSNDMRLWLYLPAFALVYVVHFIAQKNDSKKYENLPS
jgi:hypothetical protein